MAYSRIIHTKSEAVGAIPAENSLSYGEIAINYSDGHLYIKKADNTIKKVASADFAPQISTLTSEVSSITSTVGLLNLQFTQADNLDFGRSNVNATKVNNSLTYGLSNEIGSSAKDSSVFGISNKVVGENTIAVGDNNLANGNNSIVIGSYVKAPVNVAEFGKWINNSTRQSAVRLADQNVAMTLKNSATAITAGGNTGEELAATLPSNMYTIRRNVDEVLVDVNIDGTIKSCSLGDASATPGSSVQNNRPSAAETAAGEIMVKTIRKMSEAAYNTLVTNVEVDANTLYIVT